MIVLILTGGNKLKYIQHSLIYLIINEFIFPPLNERNGSFSSLAHELVFLGLSLRSTVYSFLPSSVYPGMLITIFYVTRLPCFTSFVWFGQ